MIKYFLNKKEWVFLQYFEFYLFCLFYGFWLPYFTVRHNLTFYWHHDKYEAVKFCSSMNKSYIFQTITLAEGRILEMERTDLIISQPNIHTSILLLLMLGILKMKSFHNRGCFAGKFWFPVTHSVTLHVPSFMHYQWSQS